MSPAAKAPVLVSKPKLISFICTMAAPNIAGIESKKLKRAASSLSRPKIMT